MNKMYETTEKIHEVIDLINEKYSLEIDIISDNNNVIYYTDIVVNTTINCSENYISDTGELMSLDSNNYIGFTLAEDWQFAIGEKQIKQILVGFKDLLGDTKEYEDMIVAKSQAEVLCHKWLDGLNPMFESEPELVLTELLEMLENMD